MDPYLLLLIGVNLKVRIIKILVRIIKNMIEILSIMMIIINKFMEINNLIKTKEKMNANKINKLKIIKMHKVLFTSLKIFNLIFMQNLIIIIIRKYLFYKKVINLGIFKYYAINLINTK
jgi:hypothetical protein